VAATSKCTDDRLSMLDTELVPMQATIPSPTTCNIGAQHGDISLGSQDIAEILQIVPSVSHTPCQAPLYLLPALRLRGEHQSQVDKDSHALHEEARRDTDVVRLSIIVVDPI